MKRAPERWPQRLRSTQRRRAEARLPGLVCALVRQPTGFAVRSSSPRPLRSRLLCLSSFAQGDAPISTLLSSLAVPRPGQAGRLSSVHSVGGAEEDSSVASFDELLHFQDLQPTSGAEGAAGGFWSWWRYQGLSG